MVRVLIKKQLRELGAFLFQRGKKGTRRSGGTLVLYVLLMVYALCAVGWLFYMMAAELCEPMVNGGLGWLYFAIMGIMAIVGGVFGSIFTAYSSLYRAKDNDLLLSMPVKPSALLLARMTGTYLMSLVFTLDIMVPTILVYNIKIRTGLWMLASEILVTILISIFSLTLSCILGWIIGLISAHLKGGIKRFISVAATLGLLAIYFYVYTRVYRYLQLMVANGDRIGDTVKKTLFPVYHMGLACEGKGMSLVISAAIVLAIFGLIYFALSRSFIRIATTKNSSVKAKYREKTMRSGSQPAALLKKEAKRFTGSTVYLVNCGLGTVLFLIGAAAVIIKGDYLRGLIAQMTQVFPATQGVIPLLLAAALALICSMNDISAPSVSLEGKTIWILQSMPVSAWMVLRAKLVFHVLMTAVPGLICAICSSAALGLDFADTALVALFAIAFAVFGAAMGLAMNLKIPNLDWVNEATVIKQSLPVMIGIFGSWLAVLILAGLYFLFGRIMPQLAYLAAAAAIIAAAAGFITAWIKKKGTVIFAEL